MKFYNEILSLKTCSSTRTATVRSPILDSPSVTFERCRTPTVSAARPSTSLQKSFWEVDTGNPLTFGRWAVWCRRWPWACRHLYTRTGRSCSRRSWSPRSTSLRGVVTRSRPWSASCWWSSRRAALVAKRGASRNWRTTSGSRTLTSWRSMRRKWWRPMFPKKKN